MNTKYEDLAEKLFFFGSQNIVKTLEENGLEFKDCGHGAADIKKAFSTGLMNGCGKFEREMEECGKEFEKILKVTDND